jgi:hypothetical protein
MNTLTEEQMMPRYKLVGLVERPDHKLKQFRGDEIVRTYHSMGEAIEMTGLSGSAIRFYEARLNLNFHRKWANRKFTMEDIEKLRTIKELKKYCTVQGIIRLIREHKLHRFEELAR